MNAPHLKCLNLGVLAHVDAGKTSLTERLLYAAGVIGEVGLVDDGNTQTDSLALERQRGITIKSAVVSFVLDDVTVNLIDTPGHPDFIAEVERVLNVLDGAVLVVSAVEGVQAQTRILMRALQRLNIPILIFVNKIDRSGARFERLLQGVAEKLTSDIVAMGTVGEIGTRAASFTPYSFTSCSLTPNSPDDAAFRDRLLSLLADHDEAFLASYVEGETPISYARLRQQLAVQTGRATVYPVFFGSAMTGAGVDALMGSIKTLLPARRGDVESPVSGTVFKLERGPAGEKIAYVRMVSGTVRVRDRLPFSRGREEKVTAICVFERGASLPRASVSAGRIAKLWGLGEVQIGDTFGEGPANVSQHHFAPPTLETVVVPRHPAEGGALHAALALLAEGDPLINLRQDDTRGELSLSLYGEVQKEVIGATLGNDFGLEVTFFETTPICTERPLGVGAAAETIGEPDNPFLATVGLRLEPASVGSGVTFRLSDEVLGTMPLAFFTAVEETLRETLRQGLYGWQVTDCLITLTRTGYWARSSSSNFKFDKSSSSTAGDFRNLTPLVLMAALRQARTVVCEPLHHFRLEVPADTLGAAVKVLARLRSRLQSSTVQGSLVPGSQVQGSLSVLEGEIPAARVHELQRQLPGLTRGEGVLECTFSRYEPVQGEAPTRSRSDHNPLSRKEYLMHVLGWSSAKGEHVS